MMATAAQVSAEGEYAKAKTSVWWDIENSAVPKGWDAHEIGLKLNSELKKMNYCGPLSISAYGNTNLIPNHVQQALSSTGISLNHVPSGRKDASDKKILVDMLLWVVDNPAPANIMLISGDGDFSDALHRLRMRGYNILLAHPQQASMPLITSANITWVWRSLLPSGSPSTQLVDNGSYPSLPRRKLNGVYGLKALNRLLQHEKRRKKFQKKCSKEHAVQWEVKQKLELFGERKPENTVAAPSECHEKVAEMTNKVVEAKVEASANCSSCSVVKKQAEALVDAKSIEESVADNDLQSRDVQESMEKQNKEVMEETCTTSERRGREFLQDFKERLESDGVASVNVDCVFSERRDFQVKEMREWSDAISKKLVPSQKETSETVIEELESMLNRGLEMKSGEPENAPAERNEHLEEDMSKKKKKTKKKSKLVEDGAVSYVCSLCSFTSDHPTSIEIHVKGRKHIAKVKKHTEALLDKHIQEETIQDIGQLKEVIEELRFQPGEGLDENIDDCSEKQDNELRESCDTSEKSVEEVFQDFQEVVIENENKSIRSIITELKPELSPPEEAREQIDAVIKKLELSQDENITRELESIPDQNIELNSGDTESNAAGATEHPEENIDKKTKDNMSKTGAEREAYVCSICSVTCDHPTVFESHLMGRKHAAKVKKHAEVLFDDKKVVEESLKEKDHLTDALHEVKDSSEEVCQGSEEERLGYEIREIDEARERFDSIVKGLELSLEDTLKKNSSEADNDASEEEVAKEKWKKKNGNQNWVCDWCNVTCNAQVNFDMHLIGKKHVASVKKYVPNFIYVRKLLVP